MTNVGIIGLGRWGNIIKDKIKYICKIKFETHRKDEFEDKLKSVEWVVVTTPIKSHYKIVKKCLLNKKNVFCEKPLTDNYKKTKELFILAKKKRVFLYVSDIENFKNRKIKLLKKNIIIREKKSINLNEKILYQLGYHDFTYLYSFIKNKKIKKIKIIKNNKIILNFILEFKNFSISFFYNRNSNRKVHNFNKHNLISKKDFIKIMFFKIFNKKVNFLKNRDISIFSNKIIDRIIKTTKEINK
jgi:hypothetical protein